MAIRGSDYWGKELNPPPIYSKMGRVFLLLLRLLPLHLLVGNTRENKKHSAETRYLQKLPSN